MFLKRVQSLRFKFIFRFVAIVFSVLFFNACLGVNSGDQRRSGSRSDKSSTAPLAADGISSEHRYHRTQWPQEKSDLAADPHVVFGRMANGFRFVLMQNHYPQNRVSLHLYVQVGSLNESDEQRGLAHYLEHMLFNGSTHFKPGELVKYFQKIGMQFGSDANAHTGFVETVYDINLPEGSRDSLAQGLMVMQDYAQGALLLPKEIDSERRIILAEKRMRDSAAYRTYERTMQFEFPESKISKRLPIGVEKVLKNADQHQLKEFYNTWYRPEEMILVMVGDFKVPEAISIIKETFSSLTPRAPPRPDPDIKNVDHNGLKSFYHYEKEAGNTSVTIETLQKISPKPDSLALRKEQLMADVADRIVQNRLDALVRKPNAPFTSASVGSGYFLREIKYASISADSDPENWETSLALIEQTLRKALEYGFKKSELERVQKNILAELDAEVKKSSTRDSQDLAQQIIFSLQENRVFMSPQQEQKCLTPMVQSLTLEKIHAAFKQTWSAGHRLVLVTGNKDLSDMGIDPEQRILDVYERSRKVHVPKPTEFKSAVFPYLPEPSKRGKIVWKKEITDLGIQQIEFENGVRLNLKPTDFKDDEILVRLSFGRGRSAEPVDKPGLSVFGTKVINESGLGALEKEALERALAGKNTTVTFGVDEDRMYFEGATTPEEILLMFQLLHAYLVDPGFHEDAYALAMEQFKQRYLELSTSITGALELSGRRFLANGDRRFGLPDYERFKRLTLDDVRSWFRSSLRTQDIEISMVGDFDIDSAVKIASIYLGSLSEFHGALAPESSSPPRFPTGKSLRVAVPTKIPKGLVVVAYPTTDIWKIRNTRRISVLADIISDRLREIIREKMGSAYSTYAFNYASRAYPGYGVFYVMVNIDPPEADKVVGVVKKIISDLVEKGITQDELDRALAPTLTSIKDMMRKNEYWIKTVLSRSEEYPQQLEWCRTIMSDYASISKQEILNIANQDLDNHKSATIIVTPGELK